MAYPDYIAFRTAGGDGRLLTVVAELDPDDGSRFLGAMWYHEQAPKGEFSQYLITTASSESRRQ